MDIYAYSGLWGYPAHCGLEVVRHDIGGATVILTEHHDNPIIPVAAALATQVRAERLADLAPTHIRWIEHVPARGVRAATYDELSLEWACSHQHYHHARRRSLTPDEIRQLGYEPDEVELVAGELVRRGIAVEHEGGDVRIDGYAVSRNELRALVCAAHGNIDDFLKRFERMRDLFE